MEKKIEKSRIIFSHDVKFYLLFSLQPDKKCSNVARFTLSTLTKRFVFQDVEMYDLHHCTSLVRLASRASFVRF